MSRAVNISVLMLPSLKRMLFILALLMSACVFSQNNASQTAFWKLSAIDGEFKFNGVHLIQDINRLNVSDHINQSYLTGTLLLNTKSYFWHPNFMEVKLDAGYSPETGQRQALVAPDKSEVNTLKKLNASIALFKNYKMNVLIYSNLYDGYSNRENLTNLRTKSKGWGSRYFYKNKILPITLSYNYKNSEQIELASERYYKIEGTNIQGSTSRSFGKNDTHIFLITKNSYVYDDSFVRASLGVPELVENDILTWRLRDSFYFDAKKKYRFNSSISNEYQNGSYNIYKRFQIIENIALKLPHHFLFDLNYNYFDIETGISKSKQDYISSSISHQLYLSLHTKASVEYNSINSTQYQEEDKRAGIYIDYVKKIPFKGLLTISYSLKSNIQNRDSQQLILHIQNEEQSLTDSEMVLLNEQNIDLASIIVKDETGTIIYQLYIDYLLIERNELIEIQRVPGGTIANNSLIKIDYTAIQPQAYEYNAIQSNFYANISLFEKKFEVYYKKAKQDFVDPQNINFLTLDYFNQELYGGRINIGFLSGGIEFDQMKSTIIPYRLMRYYLILQGNVKQRLMYSLNASARDYKMIIEEGNTQKYYSLTASLAYVISRNTRVNIVGSYLNQEGTGIDINLITSRAEISTRYHQMHIKGSFELYRSELISEKLLYNKFAIQISRKF